MNIIKKGCLKVIAISQRPNALLANNLHYNQKRNMNSFSLEAVSPIDGRYSGQTKELKDYFSEFALMKYRTKIEIEWVKFLSKKGIVTLNGQAKSLDDSQTKLLDDINASFNITSAERIKEIEKVTNHDVKAIEYFVKEKISENESLGYLKEYVHFSCTSEDINNLSYALMMNDANKLVICPTLTQLVDKIDAIATENANVSMLSRTHGQVASPTTVGKEFANFGYRVSRQLESLENLRFPGKLNGAVGNFNAHIFVYPEYDWPSLSKEFIESLSLEFNPYTTQIEPHDKLANYYSYLSLINTILIGFSRDIWGYISLGYFKQKTKKEEVGSSTMPHKVNPIDFENAEGNLGVANSISQHLLSKLPISRYQRDLSDSTVLRNTGVSLGYSLIAYKSLLKGLGKLEVNKQKLGSDLDDHWEVLAEPIQTVMRRYQVENPYEKLKDMTRGKEIDKQAIQDFIKTIDIPKSEKERLLKLEPKDYIGNAPDMSNFKKYLK